MLPRSASEAERHRSSAAATRCARSPSATADRASRRAGRAAARPARPRLGVAPGRRRAGRAGPPRPRRRPTRLRPHRRRGRRVRRATPRPSSTSSTTTASSGSPSSPTAGRRASPWPWPPLAPERRRRHGAAGPGRARRSRSPCSTTCSPSRSSAGALLRGGLRLGAWLLDRDRTRRFLPGRVRRPRPDRGQADGRLGPVERGPSQRGRRAAVARLRAGLRPGAARRTSTPPTVIVSGIARPDRAAGGRPVAGRPDRRRPGRTWSTPATCCPSRPRARWPSGRARGRGVSDLREPAPALSCSSSTGP